MLAHPAWKSWCKLVQLFGLTCLHELEVTDVHRLDDLILEHSKLFDEVTEYEGLKRPKHHFLTHMPSDIWMFGPPRGYWCNGFEAFNQVIKRGVNRSNFKNPEISCLRYWSMRSGRQCLLATHAPVS